jgi:hypothetical protein
LTQASRVINFLAMSAGREAPIKAGGVSCHRLFWELRSVDRSPRHARPSPRRKGSRQGARQVWAILTIGLCLGMGAFGIGRYVTVTRQAAAVAAALAAADGEIYTGSILYMPDSGNACRQLLFDNQNGQFTDNGYVDCDQAAYRGARATPKRWPAARVRVISSGFREH